MCKFAIDLGGTNKMASSWAMLAPTASPPPRSLSGEARCGSNRGLWCWRQCAARRLAPWHRSPAPERASPERPK
jgi:hypothetical protein